MRSTFCSFTKKLKSTEAMIKSDENGLNMPNICVGCCFLVVCVLDAMKKVNTWWSPPNRNCMNFTQNTYSAFLKSCMPRQSDHYIWQRKHVLNCKTFSPVLCLSQLNTLKFTYEHFVLVNISLPEKICAENLYGWVNLGRVRGSVPSVQYLWSPSR